MSTSTTQQLMLEQVAKALGPFLKEVVFVGGCTTSLFLDDAFTLDQVRFTDDVDLIVDITSYYDFHEFTEALRPLGFTQRMDNDVICRLYLDSLKVDFMPTDESILGFSNRWYKLALETAEQVTLSEGISIQVVTPALFVATKLEAFKGRGRGDVLGSHDIEDLLNIFDGRSTIVDDLKQIDNEELRNFIKKELATLLDDQNFEYAVQSTSRNIPEREKLIFERISSVVS